MLAAPVQDVPQRRHHARDRVVDLAKVESARVETGRAAVVVDRFVPLGAPGVGLRAAAGPAGRLPVRVAIGRILRARPHFQPHAVDAQVRHLRPQAQRADIHRPRPGKVHGFPPPHRLERCRGINRDGGDRYRAEGEHAHGRDNERYESENGGRSPRLTSIQGFHVPSYRKKFASIVQYVAVRM